MSSPRPLESPRSTCTAESLFAHTAGRVRWVHPNAKDDGECSDGCCDYYLCPHCGLRFRIEAAQ